MQMPGLTIGVVADDLTGANDTALQFFLTGCPAKVILSPENLPFPETAQVWAYNTESRHKSAPDAVARVQQAVSILRDRFGVENFYKKIDSTLRGPVAAECLAMLDVLGYDAAVVVPAFPQQGRRTVGGYQLVHGIPVEKTDIAHDLLSPVRQSHVPTLLRTSIKADLVGHIEISTVMHGAGPLLQALTELIKMGKRLIVVDACSNEDLHQIALVTEKIQQTFRVLPCGSGGFAQALSRFWGGSQSDSEREAALALSPDPMLILVGSNSDKTRVQTRKLIEKYEYLGKACHLDLLELSPEQILGLAPIEPAIEYALEHLGQNHSVLISVSYNPACYPQTLAMASEHQIPDSRIHAMAESVLSRFAQAVLSVRPVHVLVTGGETATHLCRVLGSHSLTIQAQVEPSIPLLCDEHGHSIVTKSGNFGSPDALCNIVKFFRKYQNETVPSVLSQPGSASWGI